MSEIEETVEKADDAADTVKTGAEDTADADTEEEVSFSEDDDDGGDDYIVKEKKKRKKRIIIGSIILGLVVLALGGAIIKHVTDSSSEDKDMYTDAAVERRTIEDTITGSSYIEPNDSYNVISMHSGDITADYISEGATVKKGDKLYQFDDEDARNQLTTAQNNLTKAQQQYEDAVKSRAQTVSSNSAQTQSARNSVERALNSLNDARKALDDRYVESDFDGKVSAVYVDNGDEVQNGAQLADIYDDSTMKLRLPFNEFDAENIYEGAAAEISVAGSGETVMGTVTEVASASTAADAHTIVVYATIELPNPGALTASDIGSAVVNGVACSDTSNFEYKDSKTLTAAASGTLMNFNIDAGDAVYAGQQIAYIDSDQLQSSYDNAQLSYDDALLSLERQVLNNDTFSQDSNIKNAQLSLEDARLQLQNAKDNVDDFVVEAPIDGTVVTKNAKSGDTIDSSNGSEALCVIYDLSCVKFSIDVDETEIALVKTGQKVTVTADAAEGKFEGKVIKVPVDGVNQNGVTTYTIDVEIDNYGALLPGMNIDAEIVVEEADNVLSVPVNSVNRGNIVFVKDDGTPHENDVTDILCGGRDDKNALNDKDENSKNGGDAQNVGNSKEGAAQGGIPQNVGNSQEGAAQGGNTQGGAAQGGRPQSGDMPDLPRNIEVPEDYRAIKVETGINDSDYIEIKSGLKEGDMVRTLNTEMSSADASFGDMEAMFGSGMRGGMNSMGGMRGGMSGGMGGGMPGGGMSGGMGGGPR